MATHSGTLAWKIPWTEEPGRLQSMGSLMTKQLHFHFSLSCIGEGNGNPLHVLAWRIPGVGEPGGLPSMGLHRVGHDWSDLAAAASWYVIKLNKEIWFNIHTTTNNSKINEYLLTTSIVLQSSRHFTCIHKFSHLNPHDKHFINKETR